MILSRRIALTAVALLVCISTTLASEESHRKAAERFFGAIKGMQLAEQIMDDAKQNVLGAIQQMAISAEDSSMVLKYTADMIDTLRATMNTPSYQKTVIDAYVSVFSESELNQFSDFFESSIGQRFLGGTKDLQRQFAPMQQERIKAAMTKIADMLQRMAAEPDARHADTTAVKK